MNVNETVATTSANLLRNFFYSLWEDLSETGSNAYNSYGNIPIVRSWRRYLFLEAIVSGGCGDDISKYIRRYA